MTRSNIESCLSEIKAEQEKRDFLRLMLKLDIRIGFVKGDKGNYYKIWIMRKDNKKKVYIKDHYHKAGSAIAQPTLQDILNTIREIVDVPKSYKKYCSVWFPKPDKDKYLDALSRANRFKDVLNREDIKSIPYFQKSSNTPEKVSESDPDLKEMIEYFGKYEIERYKNSGLTTIRVRKQGEYNYLMDLSDHLEYLDKVLRRYGFDDNGNFNKGVFPVPSSDEELEGIKNDITNFNNEVEKFNNFLKQLAAKYTKNLSPKGVIIYPPRNSKYIASTKPIIIKF